MVLPEEGEPELHDYLRVLRRRRLIIALSTFVVVASALAASFLQVPIYEATSEVLFQPPSDNSLFDPQTGQRQDPARALQTEISVLHSEPVRRDVE